MEGGRAGKERRNTKHIRMERGRRDSFLKDGRKDLCYFFFVIAPTLMSETRTLGKIISDERSNPELISLFVFPSLRLIFFHSHGKLNGRCRCLENNYVIAWKLLSHTWTPNANSNGGRDCHNPFIRICETAVHLLFWFRFTSHIAFFTAFYGGRMFAGGQQGVRKRTTFFLSIFP